MNKQFCRLFEGTGFLEPMVTYAQNFEDVTLRRALGDIEKGFYVDIGGYHPTSHSVLNTFTTRVGAALMLSQTQNSYQSF